MIRTRCASLAWLTHWSLALIITLNTVFVLPTLAWAQGGTPTPDKSPRCPDAPFRVPSGNWTWLAYSYGITGSHNGVDFVDRSTVITTTQPSWLPEPSPPDPTMDDADEAYARLMGIDFPENVTPVYSPINGTMQDAGRLYPVSAVPNGFPGSVLITGTLDATWAGKVPTTTIRLWFTHMSNYSGTVSYVVHPSGLIKEGDLIGYQGKGSTYPPHLHFSVFSSNSPYTGTYDASDGVQNPSFYLNAAVTSAYEPTNQFYDYPFFCKQTPVGVIETPAWSAYVGIASTTISGYALDRTNITQTIGISGGIDQVKLFLDGYDPSSVPAPTLNGTLLTTIDAAQFQPRPDIQAMFGNQVGNAGWSYTWNLAAVPMGRHAIYLYAHQSSPAQWHLMDVRYVNVGVLTFIPLVLR